MYEVSTSRTWCGCEEDERKSASVSGIWLLKSPKERKYAKGVGGGASWSSIILLSIVDGGVPTGSEANAMRAVGDPRAIAALRRSGESLFQKCFWRNSFSGPAGRGRGAGAGVPPRGPIGAPASESGARDDTSSIGVGRGRVIDVKQQLNEVVVDDGGFEWREAVQRRLSLPDVQNRAGDGGGAGRGRGIGVASAAQDEVGGISGTFASTQSEASMGIARGRGVSIVPPHDVARGRGAALPGPVGAAGRGVPQLPIGSFLGAEKVSDDITDYEVSEASAANSQVEMSVPASQRKFVSPQITLPSMGRGRGQVDEVVQRTIGAEPELSQQIGREGREAARDRTRAPAAKRLPLSAEEARARAIAILEEGIERNVAAEGERRRKGGMEKFADATEYFADRFKREPGQAQSQIQRTRKEKERPRRSGRPRGPRTSDELSVAEPSLEEQLTPEQEAELLRLDNESTFKENLHRLFLVQFEPEYAMEDFGRNPDIDELPVLSLEEYLQNLKPMFLRENAELSEEQKWQEAVQQSLTNAPQLEKLVEAYAGRGRMTARQQIQKMEAISERLPKSVPPEVSAFTERALITLQNNPGLTFQQKERLMNNLVSGFSSL